MPHPAQAEALLLVTGSDYAPYTAPQLPKGGVVTETVRRVLHEMGYQTRLDFYPWKRGFQRVATGQSDITFPYAKSEEREQIVLYSRPINRLVMRLFYNRENPVAFNRPEDLMGLTYCEPLGYQTEPLLAKLIRDGALNKAEAQTMDKCFQLLAQAHVDFFVTNILIARAVGERVLGKQAQVIVRHAERPINESFEYMIVSRKHPDAARLVDDFNNTYQRLYDRGVIQEIWRRHLGDTIRPPS